MSTYTMAAVQARTLAGEMVPMDASQAGEGKLAFTLRRPDRSRRRDLPVQLPAQPRRPQDRSCARRRVRRRAQARVADAALGAPAGRAGGRGRPPARWLSVVVGPSSEIGDVIVEDERVKLITFTGSGEVGWEIRERSPKKRVGLELGNATPVIVEADADVEDAATRCAANAFSFAGQSCISVQRIYVQREVYDDFKAAVRAEGGGARRRRPGRRDDGRRAADRVRRARSCPRLDRAGARRRSDDPDGRRRSTASCCARRSSSSRPRTPISRVTRHSARSARCSRTTRSTRRSRSPTRPATASRRASSRPRSRPRVKAAGALEFGGVTVNEAPTFRADQMPYGGIKESGNTREGPAWAVREMTEERLVVLQPLTVAGLTP